MSVLQLGSIQSAMMPAVMASAFDPTLMDPTMGFHDPLASDLLGRLEAGNPGVMNIIGGGVGGGGSGSPSQALRDIFPGGAVPPSGTVIQEAVQGNSLMPSLESGSVFMQVAHVHGYTMPRLDSLSLIPVAPQRLYDAMVDMTDWPSWMPRNVLSRTSAIGSGVKHHEGKTDTGAFTFHYRDRVNFGPLTDGFQISWSLDTAGWKVDRKAKGLRMNDGSWTFAAVPGRPDETLMAYQIHIEADVNKFVLRLVKPAITMMTIREFDQLIQAMANRAADSTWGKQSSGNPSGRQYSVRRV